MADTTMRTPFPPAEFPLVDSNGLITQVWREFLSNIFGRTGGSSGVDLSAITQQISDLTDDVGTFDGTVDSFVQVQQRTSEYVADLVPAHGKQYQDDLHDVASPTAAGFMSSADKVRLDSVSLPLLLAQSIVADVTAANIATDVTILTETLPANTAAVGRQRRFSTYALVSNGTTAGTLQIWIKVGATKIFMQSFTTPVVAASNRGLFVAFEWVWRTLGTTGTLQVAGTLFTNDTAAATITPDALIAPATVDTTVAQAFAMGFNWTAANASNSVTAKTASITEVV